MNLLAEEAAISSDIWIWIVGGALSIIIALVAFLGKLMLSTMKEINDELSAHRLDVAENMVTWKKFTPVKHEMEKDRHTDIELAISRHTGDYRHEKIAG